MNEGATRRRKAIRKEFMVELPVGDRRTGPQHVSGDELRRPARTSSVYCSRACVNCPDARRSDVSENRGVDGVIGGRQTGP